MKKLFSILALVLLVVSVFAQAPAKFNYQAVIRDADGNLRAEEEISLTVHISYENSGDVYSAIYKGNTNKYGVITLEIGSEKPSEFKKINWSAGNYRLVLEKGDGIPISNTLLLSVPYAMHAKTAESITGTIIETDPVYESSEAAKITASDISKLHDLSIVNTGIQDSRLFVTKIALGDSIALLRSEIPKVSGGLEADPDYNSSEAAKITSADITKLSNLSGKNTGDQNLGAYATTTLLNNKVDKVAGKDLVPNGTSAGQIQYWNGTAWVAVVPGVTGQVLTFDNGVPTWKTKFEVVEVKNPTTGKIWLDRNLGATRAATSSNDAASYGDLYQWGRGNDGHQIKTSGTTSTLSTTDVPGHDKFILAPSIWRNPQNNNLWQGVSGTNNPCPSGYRLPTESEWDAERKSWSDNNSAGAYASPLKLPAAGSRVNDDGSLNNVGSLGNYWSSTVDGTYSSYLYFLDSSANMYSYFRAYGLSVRCIKD